MIYKVFVIKREWVRDYVIDEIVEWATHVKVATVTEAYMCEAVVAAIRAATPDAEIEVENVSGTSI